MKWWWPLAVLSLFSTLANATQDFARSDWSALLAAHRGHPLVVHFWGLDCAPCLQELPAWGRFVADHPDLAVVFIQTTDAPAGATDAAARAAHLDRADLRQLVTPFDEELWFAVDRAWQGELPLTVRVDAGGTARCTPGEVDFPDLLRWLGTAGRTAPGSRVTLR